MTLEEVVSEFEGLFAAVRVVPDYDRGSSIVCTGALGLPDNPPPVICANAALAMQIWFRTARDYALETAKIEEALKLYDLIWLTEPQILKFNMTIQEGNGGHRVATPRFAVYSVLAISEHLPDAEPDAESPTAGSVPVGRGEGDRQAPRRSTARDQH